MATFGERLRQRRSALKLSQAQVANMIMVSQRQVSRYESDLSEATVEVVSRLSMALGVSADWLLGLTDRSGESLTDQERRILDIVRRLDSDRRALLEDIAEVIYEKGSAQVGA